MRAECTYQSGEMVHCTQIKIFIARLFFVPAPPTLDPAPPTVDPAPPTLDPAPFF